ncbi:hypothetical protein [Gluconobacter morbifer]|uniref:hypothetical protein n=1 Tax=Gluconobacter morbifer TaxID=479935 RepID=UPI00058E23BE|nr:hypothetical protein [Gluconobacter morbifer]
MNKENEASSVPFQKAVHALWASIFCMNEQAEEYVKGHEKFTDASRNAWENEFANACAQVCLKIVDVIREGDLDEVWLKKHVLKTPFPAPADRMSMLSVRAEGACRALKKLDLAKEHPKEESNREASTLIQKLIHDLIWSIAMTCRDFPWLFEAIEKKRAEWLLKNAGPRRYNNDLLKCSLRAIEG